MKMSTLSSLFVLMSVVSLIAFAPSAFAAHHEVTITNAPGSETPGCEPNCFVPSIATVEVGAIVTWDNTDGSAAHTASSGTPEGGPDGVFDSSLIMMGQSYSYTADTAGTFDYFCMVHPWMAGTVIVEDAAAAAAEAAAAEAAAAEAALLPIPNPAGTPFLILISIPDIILNFCFIDLITNPAVFCCGSVGISSIVSILTPCHGLFDVADLLVLPSIISS